MLLFYATVVSALLGGSSSVRPEVKCNGGSLTFPIHLTPPLFNGQLYFTPSTGGRSRLLMDKGEAKHPRIKVQSGSLRLIQLTEMDEGIFSISRDNGERQHAVTLTIIACVDEVMRDYGGRYSTKVPREAEFLEFTPLHGVDQLKVLWNRSDPQAINGGRGQINRNFYEIGNLNQADMGYYIFRGKDNNVLIRIKLIVKELRRYYNTKVHDEVLIENPMAIRLWTVAFTPVGEKENQTLMSGGRLLREEELDSYSVGFAGRLRSVGGDVQIYPVQITDSGTFAFRDRRGHLFQTAELVVDPDSFATLPLVGLIVGILFALIFCCCCVRKCCCKKRAEFAPQAAAPPAVCLHDTNQPGCPSYYAAPAIDPSTPYSMSSLVSREHTTISLEPLVAPPGGEGVNAAPSLASDFLSSDTEPTFQLKGPQYAPPLSSSSAFSDVYTSDKLNFL